MPKMHKNRHSPPLVILLLYRIMQVWILGDPWVDLWTAWATFFLLSFPPFPAELAGLKFELEKEEIPFQKEVQGLKAELDMITEKGMWELVDLPEGWKAIGNQWVSTKKYDKNGNLAQFKAKLVAQGFSQIPGQDFLQTFSSMMQLDSL